MPTPFSIALAVVEEALHRAVNAEALRHLGDLAADILQRRDIDAGDAAARIVLLARGLEAGPLAVEPVGLVRLVAGAGLEFDIEPGAPVGPGLADVGLGENALGDEPPRIDVEHRGMRRDLLVHQRLGERGLVAFVVAVPPVAEHVDHDRLVELLPELDRDLGGEHHRFRIVAVHMEDRRVDHLRHVRRIGRGARIARIGGEADLVVDDEMDRAAGAIALEVRQREAFGHHALPREGGVAVHQQRQNGGALVRRIAVLILLGARLAEHHRIDDLEMRRIRGQRQVDPVVVELAVARGAEVILDVARALDLVGRRGPALEFVEQRAVRLAHHLRQHVEAAAMRHAEHDLLHAQIAAALDDLLERGDQRLAAVEAETLGAGELEIAELLEALGLDQLHQDGAAALRREADFLVRPLDALLDPRLLGAARNVHELDAERLAVGPLADRHDLPQRAVFEAEHVIEENLAVEVGVGEPVGARIELLVVLRRLEPERIEPGMEMAAHPIGADQHQGADGVAGRLMDIGRSQPGARRGLRLQLAANRLLDLDPVAVQRRGQVVPGGQRPVRPRPGRSFRILLNFRRRILQAAEEIAPLGLDRIGILFVGRVKIVDVAGVGTVEERGKGKCRVCVLARHDPS